MVSALGISMPSGCVKWYDIDKGYGYIQPDETVADVKFYVSENVSTHLK